MKKTSIAIVTILIIVGLGDNISAQHPGIRMIKQLFNPKSKIALPSDFHLRPINEEYFKSYSYKHEYYDSIREMLFGGLGSKPILRYIHWIQIATPIQGLDLELDRKTGKYFLILHAFSRRRAGFTKNRENENIGFSIYKREISGKSASLLKGLFEEAIKGTKIYEEEFIVLDGEYYYFFVNKNDELIGGEACTPSEKSKMGRLANVGLQLILLTKSEVEIIEFDKKFTKKIMDLTNELKQTN